MEIKNKPVSRSNTGPQEFWKNYFSGSPYRKLTMGILYLGNHDSNHAIQLAELEHQIKFVNGSCKKSNFYKQLKAMGEGELAEPLVKFSKKMLLSKKHKERTSLFPVAQAMIEEERGSNFSQGKYMTLIFYSDARTTNANALIRSALAESLGQEYWSSIKDLEALRKIWNHSCSSRIIEEEGRNLDDGYRANYPIAYTASGAKLKENKDLMPKGKGKPSQQASFSGRRCPEETPDCTRSACGRIKNPNDTWAGDKGLHRRTRAMLRKHGVFLDNFQGNPEQVPLDKEE